MRFTKFNFSLDVWELGVADAWVDDNVETYVTKKIIKICGVDKFSLLKMEQSHHKYTLHADLVPRACSSASTISRLPRSEQRTTIMQFPYACNSLTRLVSTELGVSLLILYHLYILLSVLHRSQIHCCKSLYCSSLSRVINLQYIATFLVK